MLSSRTHAGIAALAQLVVAAVPTRATSGQVPWWLDSLGYAPSQLSSIRVGTDRFPYLPVRIEGTELWLLFDTGNMAGLTVATPVFERLRLPVTGTVRRLSSSGQLVGEFRVGRASRVEALGHTATDVAIREFDHPRLDGLFGPGDLPGGGLGDLASFEGMSRPPISARRGSIGRA